MSNHLKTVNEALHSLLIGTFKFPVELKRLDVGEIKELNFKQNEYCRYWGKQEYTDGNSDGGNVEYTYRLNHYFNTKRINRNDIETKMFGRLEDYNQLLMSSRTYQPSSVYKWHDLLVVDGEILQVDDDEPHAGMYYIDLTFTMKRFNQWS